MTAVEWLCSVLAMPYSPRAGRLARPRSHPRPCPAPPLGQQYADERPQPLPHLAPIETPADLRRVPDDKLPAVADELRRYLIEAVASSGGHFGAGLGVVELT